MHESKSTCSAKGGQATWRRYVGIGLGAAAVMLPSSVLATTVLFVGNSFTQSAGNSGTNYNAANITDANNENTGGVPGIFKKMATEGGFNNVSVTIEAVGGQTLAYHYANKASIIGGTSWDFVALQEYSTRPLTSASGDGNGTNIAAFRSAVQNRNTLIHTKNPAAKVLLYETWARPDKIMGGYFPNLQAMQTQLKNSYSAAATDFGLAGYAPAGDAFLQAITNGLANDPTTPASEGPVTLWNSDNYHASAYGSYLVASIFYEEILGGDARTLPTGAGSAVAGLGLNAVYADQLQDIAHQYAQTPEPSAALLIMLGASFFGICRKRAPGCGSEKLRD